MNFFQQFRGIETSDAGRYICQAVNNAGTARAVAEVVVNGESTFFLYQFYC